MAVISGYHVDEYCLPSFRRVVQLVVSRLGGRKVLDFAEIVPGDWIARVPPKIQGDQAGGQLKPIPVYQIAAVGDSFDDDGKLVREGSDEFLYFEASACYHLDLNPEEPCFAESTEAPTGVLDCFEGREVGKVKEKYLALDEELRGILYKIPGDRVRSL